MSNPVTYKELLERGMDEELLDLVYAIVGDVITNPAITVEQMAVFGYGRPCECGEKGLAPGETTCLECESNVVYLHE